MSNGPADRRVQPPPPVERPPAPTEARRQRPLSPEDIRPSQHRPGLDATAPDKTEMLAEPAGKPAKPPRRILKFISLLLLAALAWTAWMAAAFYDLTSGLRDADAVALERRIDWSSVRQGLREDLQVKLAAPAGDSMIEALVSQKGIANLLQSGKLNERGWYTDTAAPESGQRQGAEWSRVRYAFFSGGPFAFRVDLKPDSDTIKAPIVLLFRWSGDWRLTRVFLPLEAAGKPAAASQSPPQPAASAAAPEAALPAGAQRAAIYEEDPSDPKGKYYPGSVTWRTEQLPSVTGGASELAVTARVSIPARPFGMTLAIRRNFDRALPASHIIDLKFDQAPDAATGGLLNVADITMKPTAEAPGQPLAGSSVKVSDDFYLIGLSAIELDVQHNMTVLKERPWFGVRFVYKNNSRAILAIEKGETGDKSIAEALTRWAAVAVESGGASR
jgi:hypothetical protein